MSAVVGIDPGMSGAVAVLVPRRAPLVLKMPRTAEDLYHALLTISTSHPEVHWAVEQLPPCVGIGGEGTATGAQMGVLHRNAGRVEGVIWGLGYVPRMYAPQSWQRPLRDELPVKKSLPEHRRQQEWKHALRDCAQARFPGVQVPLYAADALLIANHHLHQLKNQ